MSARERLVLVDGHSQIYRAVFTPGSPLTSPTGEPTRGTYYFVRMLMKLITSVKPDHLVMALDGPRDKLYRRKIYPEYKANRESADEIPIEVVTQVKRIKQLVRLLGIPTATAEAWEADDVIATLVDVCSDEYDCVIVSRDKDLHQLVRDNVTMFDPMDGTWITVDDVVTRWGVHPEQLVDVQALAGDSTDNLPGIKGIGPAGAAKLLLEYHSLEGIEIDDLSPKMQEKFEGVDLQLLRSLVELKRDVDVDFDPDDADLNFDGLDYERARPMFKRLGFKRWS